MNQRLKNACKFIIPTVLSQCAFFMFTIIDGIFVGNGVGSNALGAVNMAFPFILILNAFFMLTTIGGVTITAIRMGRNELAGANQVFMHSFCATLFFTILFSFIGVFLTDPLVRLLGASNDYFSMVHDYIFWYSIFAIPAGMSMLMQGFGRNDNAPVLVMTATIVSTLCNIILDWLFIFPLQQGIAGAAIATGISQVVSFLIISSHFVFYRGILRIKKVPFDKSLLVKILQRGLPEMLSQLTSPIMIVCMNYVILRYIGNDGINAYSIIGYVTSFSFAIFLGVAEGIQPLLGRSYGEKNSKYLHSYLWIGLIFSTIGSIIVYFLTVFFGTSICQLFGADASAIGMAISSMPKHCWAFIFTSFNTILSAYLYSTKRTKEAVAANIARGFILIPLCVTLLSIWFGESIVWFTVGIAEILAFIVTVGICVQSEKNGLVFTKD